MTASQKFVHRVRFLEGVNKVVVERVFDDGSSHLFTELDCSQLPGETPTECFERCSSRLGSDILLDALDGRRLFGLD
jgi:hypothetical protein